MNEEYAHDEGLYTSHTLQQHATHIEPGTQGRKDIYLRYSEIMNRVCTLFQKARTLDDFERFFPPAYRRVGSKGENGSEQQNIGKGTSTMAYTRTAKILVQMVPTPEILNENQRMTFLSFEEAADTIERYVKRLHALANAHCW